MINPLTDMQLNPLLKALLVAGAIFVLLFLSRWHAGSYRAQIEQSIIQGSFEGFSQQLALLHQHGQPSSLWHLRHPGHSDLWLNAQGWPANASNGSVPPLAQEIPDTQACVEILNLLLRQSNVRSSPLQGCNEQLCAEARAPGCLYVYYQNKEDGFFYNAQNGQLTRLQPRS